MVCWDAGERLVRFFSDWSIGLCEVWTLLFESDDINLDILRAATEEVYVKGQCSETDIQTLFLLPSLYDSHLLDKTGNKVGVIADFLFHVSTGKILFYLISRSDPRLPGSSRWKLDISKICDVKPYCFSPKPKVSSTLLSFKPVINKYKLKNPKTLEKITSVLFSNRRKMINKNLKKLFKNKLSVLKKLNINLKKRPGELNNETFYKIAIEYEKLFD